MWFYILRMGLFGIKKLLLSSTVFLAVLHPINSLSADSDELRQKLDQLQKSLQGPAPEEPLEELEKKLQVLKELLKGEGLMENERKGLEERLKTLKGQLIPQEKPLIVIEEAAATPEDKRFFIEGRYWLAYVKGANKDVAAIYSLDTKQTIEGIETSPGPANAFMISGGYRHANGNATFVRFWHLNASDSVSRTKTSSLGISGTEGSDYYYQNINQWGTSTFAVRGGDKVEADASIEGTNLDLIHAITIGKGADKELGVALGLKYAQVDSDYEITYSSSTPIYNIESNVENTLLGPVFGIYGKGRLFGRLGFTGMFNAAIAWDHIRAKRSEYDYTVPQYAVPGVARATDLPVTVVEGEVGVRYPFSQNLLLGLDYKMAYFGGLPFEFKPTDSTLIDTVELIERDILIHGLTAEVSYSF